MTTRLEAVAKDKTGREDRGADIVVWGLTISSVATLLVVVVGLLTGLLH